MSKKKSQTRQQRRATSRQARITRQQEVTAPVNPAQERAAIRTLIMGAALIALFSAFFGFEVGGQTLYGRLFGGAQPADAKSPLKP